MPRRDKDEGVCFPFPIRSRPVYRGDNPEITTGAGSKREFEEVIYRGNMRLRVDEAYDFGPSTTLAGGYVARTTGTPTTNAIEANTANGVYQAVLAATNEAETAGVDYGDQLIIPATKKCVFEALVQIPTALGANQHLIVGLQTAYNATLNSTTKFARFRLSGSMALKVEFQDGTTTSLVTALNRGGLTLVAGEWYLLTVDMQKTGVVRYFVDDTLFFTQPIGAFLVTDLLQPAIYLNKASGTGIPSLLIDWARVAWNRF